MKFKDFVVKALKFTAAAAVVGVIVPAVVREFSARGCKESFIRGKSENDYFKPELLKADFDHEEMKADD